MLTIFLLEDDATLGKHLKFHLESNGYQVHWVTTLKIAMLDIQKVKPHLIILDWNLPDGTGFDFFKSIKDSIREVPVLFLTMRVEEDNAIVALREGAQDYLRKPLGEGELLVKIKKALGEAHNPTKKIRFGELQLDLSSHEIEFRGKSASLKPREFTVMKMLLKNSDNIISREAILQHMDGSEEVFDRAVDTYMSRLRKTVQDLTESLFEIKAIYGVGYQLKEKQK